MTAAFHAGGGNSPALGLPGLCGATRIATIDGNIPVEWLRARDLVLTRDGGYQPLLWIGPDRATRPARPTVRLPGIHPAAPALRLAAGHGILIADPALALRHGSAEALISADQITGVLPDPARRDADIYFHLLLGRHEIVLADGVWIETLAAPAVARCLPAEAVALARPLLRQGALPARPRIIRPDPESHLCPIAPTPPLQNRSFRVA